MKNIFLLALSILLFPSFQYAQQTWSLEKCIKHAQDKSLTIKQAQFAVANNKVTLKQNKMSRYPTINASTGLNLNSGRTVDFNNNSISTQTSFSNNIGINSSVLLYQGGRIKNSIKQSEMDIKASELDVEQTSRDIALQVAQAYLQVLLSEEQLQSVKGQLKQTEDQLVQTNKLIKAGTLPANNKLDIEAQIARNEQTVIAAQNAVSLGYLTLKQLMFLDVNTEINVFAPGLRVDESTLKGINLNSIYSQAMNTQPNIRAGELRVKSADVAEDIALATKKPTISLSAGVNTGYSSLGKEIASYTPTIASQPFSFVVDGTTLDGELQIPQDVPNLRNQPYLTQLNNNLGQNVGLNVSYPIWDNKQAKLNAERAKLSKENVKVQNELLKQRLRVDIQNAYTNAIAAQKTYEAAERSLIAQNASYENTKKRYDLGSANAFELSTARNTLTLADTELIRSKYDYVFRLKILDFYAGRPIKL
jgi:outer membrane protein